MFLMSALVAQTAATSATAADGSAPLKILAFGDSLTEGYGLENPSTEGFVPQLEAALNAQDSQNEQRAQVKILNAGVAGDSTQGGVDRLAWSLFDQPDAVILQLGANDMLRGFDPTVTRANLTTLLDELVTANLPVLLTGMQASPSMGEDFVEQFNPIYPELAAAYADQGVLFYPFFLDGVVADAALNQADGMHPNPAGVAVLVERILPSVQALVDAIE